MEQKFNFKKVGNKLVAFDTVDKKRTYGFINLKSEKFCGDTRCMIALYEHLESLKPKNKVKKSVFLEWYFSDEEDYLMFAENIANELKSIGKVTITVEDIFNDGGYIPAFIVEGQEDDTETEYEPEDCELID